MSVRALRIARLRTLALRAVDVIVPAVPLLLTLVWPLSAIVTIPLLRLLMPRHWNAAFTAAVYAAGATLAVIILTLLLPLADIASWFVPRFAGLSGGLVLALILGSRDVLTVRLRSAGTRINITVGAVAVVAALFAIALPSLQFALALLRGNVFGDAAAALPYLFLPPALAPRLEVLLVLADAFAGLWAVRRLVFGWGGSNAAAWFAGACWFVCSARLAPQAMGFQPTCIVPLALLLWRERPRSTARLIWAIVGAALISLIAPQLVIPIAIVVIADALISPNRRDLATALPCAAVALVVTFILKVSLFAPYTAIIGGPLDDVLRFNGGDGTYPWEWLNLGAVSAAGGATAASLAHGTFHLGNLWLRSASIGIAALIVLVVGALDLRRVNRPLLRFAGFALFVSLWAALPSHIFGTPVPGPTLFLWAAHAAASTGAYNALGGVLALMLVTAAAFDVLASRDWGRYLLAVAAVLLVMFSPVAGNTFWNPSQTVIYSQLHRLSSTCTGKIAFVEGSYAPAPIARSYALASAYAFGSLQSARDRLVSEPYASFQNGDGSMTCAVVDDSVRGDYVQGPLQAAAVYPPEMFPKSPVAGENTRFVVPGWSVETIAGQFVVTYRR